MIIHVFLCHNIILPKQTTSRILAINNYYGLLRIYWFFFTIFLLQKTHVFWLKGSCILNTDITVINISVINPYYSVIIINRKYPVPQRYQSQGLSHRPSIWSPNFESKLNSMLFNTTHVIPFLIETNFSRIPLKMENHLEMALNLREWVYLSQHCTPLSTHLLTRALSLYNHELLINQRFSYKLHPTISWIPLVH